MTLYLCVDIFSVDLPHVLDKLISIHEVYCGTEIPRAGLGLKRLVCVSSKGYLF